MLQSTIIMLMRTCKKLLKKNKNRHDSDLYWPTPIKDTIQWFPFPAIMKHTANIINPDKGIISSSLKASAMFELWLIVDKEKLDTIAKRCVNSKKEIGLYFKYQHLKKRSLNLWWMQYCIMWVCERITRVSCWPMKSRHGQDGLNPFGTS